jgi:hypothetical protein
MKSSYLLIIFTGAYFVVVGVPAPHPTRTAECDGCGGVCGDSIVQSPFEQCDLGPKLNGAWNSGCSKNCTCSKLILILSHRYFNEDGELGTSVGSDKLSIAIID